MTAAENRFAGKGKRVWVAIDELQLLLGADRRSTEIC